MFFSTETTAKMKNQDNRLTRRLMEYWNEIRSGQALPLIEKFNAQDLEGIMGQCCIWRIEQYDDKMGQPVWRYEYFGHNLRSILGTDLTGEKFSDKLQHFPAAQIITKVDEVLHSKIPLADEGEFFNPEKKKVKYRSCLLPFGNEKGEITNILLGMSWSAVAEMQSAQW